MVDPFAEFVGVPFLDRGRTLMGADCWGLFRLALLKVAGLELPTYDDYASVVERRVNAEMIRGGMGDWRQVPAGQEQRFDGMLMKDGRYDSHIGLVVQRGRMLHTYQGASSCVDRYHDSPFREQLIGFWRHRSFFKDE